LKLLLDADENIILVDLRPAPEFRRNRLPGARSIPLTEFARRFKEVPDGTGSALLLVRTVSGGRKSSALGSPGISECLRNVGRLSRLAKERLSRRNNAEVAPASWIAKTKSGSGTKEEFAGTANTKNVAPQYVKKAQRFGRWWLNPRAQWRVSS
jgi:hypothetical protein